MTPLTDDQVELYRAYSASYRAAGSRRFVEFAVDFVFAGLALLIVLSSVFEVANEAREDLSSYLPLLALGWLCLREAKLFGDPVARRSQAVNIQEQFDLSFWKPDGIDDEWNSLLCGPAIPRRTVKELAADYRGETIGADYWVDTAALAPTTGALVRILQSSGWGERGHRRYARLNHAAVVLGVAAVMLVGALANLDTLDLAAVAMAVAPPLLGRLNAARAHRALAHSRKTLESHVTAILNDPRRPVRDQDVRAGQDELVRLRLADRRIPEWLYRRYQERDQAAIDTAISELLDKLRARN